jgi:SPFH domain/Band 7 family protein
MKRFIKGLALVAIAFVGLSYLTACSSVAPNDEIGLYYMQGPFDGDRFDHCFDPGTTTSPVYNNRVVLLPTSLRTWNIAPDGGDSKTPITVNSAPQEGQPSGVQVNLWTQTNFVLNTNCGKDDKDANSPIVKFWTSIGNRYSADTQAGWDKMLQSTIVTALETASRSVVRQYTADSLVSGVNREEVQNKISALFQSEIQRVTGGNFFCSPTFNRTTTDCGEVQLLLKDVDYTNPAIQQARDEKQAAIEHATALVAQAQGQVDAAAKVGSLYNNPSWVALQEAQLKLQEVQECAKNPNCTIVVGSDQVMVNAK